MIILVTLVGQLKKMLYSAHKEFTYDVCDRKWPGIDVQLQQYGPYEYVFLLAGTNDLAQEEATTILSNLQALTDKFLASASYVGLLTVPTMGAERSREGIRLVRTAVNDGLEAMTKTHPSRVFLVDTSVALPQIEEDEESMSLWDNDKLHLSEKGSAVIAKTVFAAMLTFQLSLPPSAAAAAAAVMETSTEEADGVL